MEIMNRVSEAIRIAEEKLWKSECHVMALFKDLIWIFTPPRGVFRICLRQTERPLIECKFEIRAMYLYQIPDLIAAAKLANFERLGGLDQEKVEDIFDKILDA